MKKITISKSGVASVVGGMVAANPAWVLDHDIWERAKKRAPGAPWGVVTNIYKKYGGRVGGQVGSHADEIELLRGIEHEKEHLETIENTIRAMVGGAYHLAGKKINFAESDYDKKAKAQGARTIHEVALHTVQAIAQDHLREIPDYYTRLDRMEREAKKQPQIHDPDGSTFVRPGLNWGVHHVFYYDPDTENAYWLDKGVLQAAARNADGTFEWANPYDPDGLSETLSDSEDALRIKIVKALRSARKSPVDK